MKTIPSIQSVQVATVKELKEALSIYPDNYPLMGVAADPRSEGASNVWPITVFDMPSKIVVIQLSPAGNSKT